MIKRTPKKQKLLITVATAILVACSHEPSVDRSSRTVLGSAGSEPAFGSAGMASIRTVGGSAGSEPAFRNTDVAGRGATNGLGVGEAGANGGVSGTSADGSIGMSQDEKDGFPRKDSSVLFDSGLSHSDPFSDADTDVLNAGDSGPDTGDASIYRPCPTNGDPCKILPLGDSITWGWGDEGNAGYRGPLFALAVAAQQNITFTGSLQNGPNTVLGQAFPKQNEGHNGWTISTVNSWSDGKAGIMSLIPSPAFDSSNGGIPNIILMMIGTNDTDDSTAAEMVDRLATLMDNIFDFAPEALLVVAKITPKSWTATVVDAYNDAIPGLIQTRTAAGKHVMLADMNTGFTATMMSSDNLHPNREGYKFMADCWYSVIGPLLPK